MPIRHLMFFFLSKLAQKDVLKLRIYQDHAVLSRCFDLARWIKIELCIHFSTKLCAGKLFVKCITFSFLSKNASMKIQFCQLFTTSTIVGYVSVQCYAQCHHLGFELYGSLKRKKKIKMIVAKNVHVFKVTRGKMFILLRKILKSFCGNVSSHNMQSMYLDQFEYACFECLKFLLHLFCSDISVWTKVFKLGSYTDYSLFFKFMLDSCRPICLTC